MKRHFFILIILIIIISFFIVLINIKHAKSHILIDGKSFEVEIAKTEAQKEKGLAKYNKISDNFAMEFPFEKAGYYAFWMKDMKFSIDIIYINKNKIVQIFNNVTYPTSDNKPLAIYKPGISADEVLEINGSLSQKYNFKIGDSAKIEY